MGNKPSPSDSNIKYIVQDPNEKIKEKAYQIEKKILSLSGLKIDEEIYIDDVYIDYYGNNYLHTIRCGRPEHQIPHNVVIIHGYQGSSITFFKLFKYLYPNYNIYCPDIIGMSLSSRPLITFDSTEEYLNFFVESFEKWRQALGIEKFHLIGHSLGGYLASLYSLKYPEFITNLSLLSPAGITDISSGGNINENMPISKKIGFAMLGKLWFLKPTLKGVYDNPVTRIFMKKPLRKRYDISEEESELLAQLTELSFQYPKDLDRAIYFIFKNPIPTVHIPLENVLFDNVKDFKVDIYYGRDDWMDRAGCLRLCYKDSKRFKLYYIKSGHQFNIENADELGPLIIENFKLNNNDKKSKLNTITNETSSKSIELEKIINN